jgi:membrane peptidoglycan carboxypeptidase
VQNGTGQKAAISGVQIGGKTGTAQKYDRQSRRYIQNNYLSSFIGFVPYETPEYVLGIFIDAPKLKQYGGDVAAPIFASIMGRILGFTPHENIQPETDLKITKVNQPLPNLQGFPFSAIEEYLEIKDVDYMVQGEGTHILSQTSSNDEVQLILGIPEIKAKVFPNLHGMTIRESLQHIDFSKVRVRIVGHGRVIEQSIKPGTIITKGSEVILTCSR